MMKCMILSGARIASILNILLAEDIDAKYGNILLFWMMVFVIMEKGKKHKMDEYILNACGKILSWKRFLSSADPLVYDKTLVDLASRNVTFSAQGVFDRYCNLYYREHGVQEPMNLEEPYTPSSADLDDFAEFQAERNPMFENFTPDKYDF